MSLHFIPLAIINMKDVKFWPAKDTNNIQCMIINFRQQSATIVKLEFLAAVNMNTTLFRQFIVQYSLVLMTSQPNTVTLIRNLY